MVTEVYSIILIAEEDRNKINIDLNSLQRRGYRIISSLDSLNESDLLRYETMLILGSYPNKDSNKDDIEIFVKSNPELKYYYLGDDETSVVIMSEYSTAKQVNFIKLTIDDIMQFLSNNIINQGTLPLSRKILEMEKLLSETNDRKMRDVIMEYVKVSSELIKSHETHKRTMKALSDEKSKTSLLEEEVKGYRESYSELFKSASDRNEKTDEVEIILSEDIYEKIDVTGYPNAPKIIYIKVHQEVDHLNGFIDTLHETIYRTKQLSVKTLCLFDHDGPSRSKILDLEKYYFVNNNNVTTQDILENDRIIKCGNYMAIMDYLLKNSRGLGALIIMDFKPLEDEILLGTFLGYKMIRNINRAHRYKASLPKTIHSTRYNKVGGMYWGHVEGIKDLEIEGERHLRLRVEPAIKLLINDFNSMYEVGIFKKEK